MEEQEYSRALNLQQDVTFLQPISTEIKCTEKLSVGDIVAIKNYKYKVKVEHINYELPIGGFVDYAGSLVELKSERLVIFNQKDIDYVVEKSNNVDKGIVK